MKIQIGNGFDGRQFATINNEGCRTKEQYKAFMELIKIKKFLFLCDNPFQVDYSNEKYNCSFCLMGYEEDNKLHSYWLTPKGTVKELVSKKLVLKIK